MKGRIIGREGRNIRALEHLTGVDFIIDDTPQAVVLSSLSGLRREVARTTLEKLIEDGRIHPARIEEMYYLSKAELDDHVRQAGERGGVRGALRGVPRGARQDPRRLRYRTSYGQHVLKHTLEVVHLAGIMASELGSVKTAKRAALLHDVGKAMTHEVEGSRAHLGAAGEALRREPGRGACDRGTPLRGAAADCRGGAADRADAISGVHPGARASLEHYIKRLGALEEIATAKPGVAKAYALQAGREIKSRSSRPKSTTTVRCSSRTRSRGRSKISSSTPVR